MFLHLFQIEDQSMDEEDVNKGWDRTRLALAKGQREELS